MPKKAEPTDVPAPKVEVVNPVDEFVGFIEKLRQNGTLSPEVAEVVKAHIERARGEFGG